MAEPPLTRTELLQYADTVAVDLATAARALGISLGSAYDLARAGRLPVPVLRCGTSYRVPTASLLAALGIPLPLASEQRIS